MKVLQGLTFIAVLALTACASDIPRDIRVGSPTAPGVNQARGNNALVGSRVRWGGTIAAVENSTRDTLIQIVSRPLGSDGTPKSTDDSEGRFIARFDSFMDPAIYAAGRMLTVSGTLEPGITRKVGDYDYSFPVVHVTTYYLWPEISAYDRGASARDYYGWGWPYWGGYYRPWGYGGYGPYGW